jgi:hypothetical protein
MFFIGEFFIEVTSVIRWLQWGSCFGGD